MIANSSYLESFSGWPDGDTLRQATMGWFCRCRRLRCTPGVCNWAMGTGSISVVHVTELIKLVQFRSDSSFSRSFRRVVRHLFRLASFRCTPSLVHMNGIFGTGHGLHGPDITNPADRIRPVISPSNSRPDILKLGALKMIWSLNCHAMGEKDF